MGLRTLGLHGFIEAADEVFGRRHEHGAVAEQQIDIARGPLPDEIERRGGRPYVYPIPDDVTLPFRC